MKKHFRYYRVSRHPALIVDNDEHFYVFHRVTSSKKSGHHKNWVVYPNPDVSRSSPMYIVRRRESDKKNRFGKKLSWDGEIAWKNKK